MFLLSDRKLAEVRPMARGLSLLLILPYAVAGPRVRRSERLAEGRLMHYIRLTQLSDVDDELLGWLTDAYDLATS